MALAGRQSVPGLDGGKSRQLYHCRVEGCEQTPSGRYLVQHYKNSAAPENYDGEVINQPAHTPESTLYLRRNAS